MSIVFFVAAKKEINNLLSSSQEINPKGSEESFCQDDDGRRKTGVPGEFLTSSLLSVRGN